MCDPLYYGFINKMDRNDTTNRMKAGKYKKYSKKNHLTKQSKLCSYNKDSVNVLDLSYSSMQNYV